MTIDAAALERSSSPPIELLGSQTVKADGSSAGVAGFDAYDRVYVTVGLAEFRRDGRDASLSVTVEQSSDGETWESAASPVEFVGDGVQFVTVDQPSGHLRVTWATANGFRSCRLLGVSATPGSLDSPGGGDAPGGSSPHTKSSWVGVTDNIDSGPPGAPVDFTAVGITFSGDTLLDLTDPLAPTVIAEGTYALTFMVIQAHLGAAVSYQTCPLDKFAAEWAGVTRYAEAGDTLYCTIEHDIGAPAPIDVNIYLQRLS